MSEQEQELQQPYLGQRVHVESQDFGTVIGVQEHRVKGTGGTRTYIRVELDARGSHWYTREQLELLPTYPAV